MNADFRRQYGSITYLPVTRPGVQWKIYITLSTGNIVPTIDASRELEGRKQRKLEKMNKFRTVAGGALVGTPGNIQVFPQLA